MARAKKRPPPPPPPPGGGGGGGGGGGTRITFYGFGAFVGSLKGPTHCGWWHDDPNSIGFNTKLIETDLSKTPSEAQAGTISIHDIQVDDHRSNGGLTMIGPRFPQGGMVGAIWLRDTVWSNLTKPPPHPSSSDAAPYEHTCLVYLDGPLKGRRFLGVHARVRGGQGSLTNVELFQLGRSRVPGERPFGAFWFDLAQVAHPVAPGASEIGAGSTVTEGALFLEDRTIRLSGGNSPKIPPYLGADAF